MLFHLLLDPCGSGSTILVFYYNFSFLDPEQHIACGAGSRRENERGSGSTALHYPQVEAHQFYRGARYWVRRSELSARREETPRPEPAHCSHSCPPNPTYKESTTVVALATDSEIIACLHLKIKTIVCTLHRGSSQRHLARVTVPIKL